MKRPRTFDDAQRRRMMRSLWAQGSKQLAFDFVSECETQHGPRWLEIEEEKAGPTEPPKQERSERKKMPAKKVTHDVNEAPPQPVAPQAPVNGATAELPVDAFFAPKPPSNVLDDFDVVTNLRRMVQNLPL